MRNSSKRRPSQIAELLRNGGGVRAVKHILCAALFAAAAVAQSSTGYRIDTFAGSRDLRDNGPAPAAWLRSPNGVALDGAGNLFIADTGNHRIRKVDSAGVITTVAGTGRSGFGGNVGDGGPAIQAAVYYPSGVAVDGAGNLFIAERFYNQIRKVDSAGVITTVAGTREFFGGFSGDNGPATAARLRSPGGVALDGAGNLFIADTGNDRIRKVDSAGVITTVAGTGESFGGFSGDGGPAIQAALYYPSGVALDGAGNLFIADTGNDRIRKVDSAGVITTVAGAGEFGFAEAGGFGGDGGPAIQAALNYPSDVVADGAGNLYIADTDRSRIRKVDAAGVISTVAGTGSFGFSGDGGPAVEAQLNHPADVTTDGAGNLYIADRYNDRIRKVDSAGVISTVAGTGESFGGFSGDGGPAIQAALNYPRGVAVDGAGNLFIADTGNHRIRKVDSAGVISTVAGTGESFGGFSGDGGPAIQAALNYPRGVGVDGAGNFFIADTDNHLVRKLTPVGSSTPPNPTGPALTTGQPATFRLEPADTPTIFLGGSSFRLEVPENASRVTFTLESVDPDINVDLYVRYGEDNDIRDGRVISDYSSEGPTGNEEIIITRQSDPPLRAGTYFVSLGVRTTGVVAEGTVRAEFDTPLQTGGPTYYFPHLAVGASWQTTITYINYSREEVTCQTDFISDHGSPLMVSFAELGMVDSRTDVLPPGGSVHQETDVDLSAPLAPGWALANCSGPVQASLLFRQQSSEGMPVAEAGVNAATVPATRFVTFAEQGEGKNGTGVAYANPSDTAALVTFTARDADGEVLAIEDLMLPPNGHGAQNMPPLFDLSSFTGSLEVTSTEPIVSLSLNFEAAPVFSSLPPGELDAAAQGSTTYYFPHLAVGASWQTTITYINYSREEVTCQTDFISDHGSPLMVSFAELGMVDSRTDVLPPGGSVHQETDVDLSAPLAPGWALANCSGPVQASLLFRQHSSEGMPVAEAGVNAATVPATRFVTFAEQGEGKNGTGVAYANPSDTAALVTFTARDADGEVLAIKDLMLPPNGHGAQNMPTLFDLSSFTGSLEVTSTEPIVSLSLNFEAAPVFSSLSPGELDLPVAPPGGINWCTDLQTVWVSFRLKNDKTVSVCRDPSDKLVYSFGTLGREPELEYEGPIVATFSLPAMLWGESIGDLSTLADAVAAGEVGGSDELAREMVTAIESGETNGFYVLNMLTGLISESVYLFRTGGWEYAVVSSVGRPMGGCDGVDRRIDLLSPDQIRYHLRGVGSDLDCGAG